MTTKEHLSKHDREIAEIRAIQRTTNEYLGKLARAMVELSAAQKETQASLKAYLDSRRVTNGHSKRKVDLQ
jgi:hypothetical protein